MVFPSVPGFLDPPNWNQGFFLFCTSFFIFLASCLFFSIIILIFSIIITTTTTTIIIIIIILFFFAQQEYQHATGQEIHQQTAPQRTNDSGSSSARPTSMADRARLAKLPPPGPGLKCPRCDSTNTKFCYFNNYSLLQPRHFCKTCRRYWTRGGALRNVPVGGGCRRNRRSKSATSTKTATDRQSGLSQISHNTSSQTSQSLVLSPMQHHLLEYGSAGNLGLNFAGFQPVEGVDFQLGSSSSVPQEQWKLQPFPQTAMGLFPFNAEVGEGSFLSQLQGKGTPSSSGLVPHLNLGSVKMEENPREMNLTRQYLTISGDNQYWNVANSGNNSGWTELPDFNSSAGHIL